MEIWGVSPKITMRIFVGKITFGTITYRSAIELDNYILKTIDYYIKGRVLGLINQTNAINIISDDNNTKIITLLEIRYVQVRSVQKLNPVQPIQKTYRQMKTIP